MAAIDFSAELKDLQTTVQSIQQVTDVDRLRADIKDLEQQSAAPDLWDDPEAAQKVTSRLSHLNA
ncbi:MAG: peptide chain release factor 2, partial [Angustibacter sp.]